MKLLIGDKNYSSWSMRPWVLMKHFGVPFEEVWVRLNEPDTREAILAHSPSGKVPCLVADDGSSVWDSLAIAETLAERFPQHAMWPRDPVLRGHARSVSAEMHSGFGDMRTNMWMNIRASFPGKGATPGALADIARIDEIWTDCICDYGGPFLFGEFSIADAMYAPVVMRFNTWKPALSDMAAAYAERVTQAPAVHAWIQDALHEGHAIGYYDNLA
ncbi:MAG: glutathione S-transferase family protein [Paraburkholderia sp.]|uniref:glutathione S-transferase family protein n=1 Tax=Paraburkholderia sp. TaxID=1926495 RepID=UPI003C4AD9EF